MLRPLLSSDCFNLIELNMILSLLQSLQLCQEVQMNWQNWYLQSVQSMRRAIASFVLYFYLLPIVQIHNFNDNGLHCV